jgi:hypothetical protein
MMKGPSNWVPGTSAISESPVLGTSVFGHSATFGSVALACFLRKGDKHMRNSIAFRFGLAALMAGALYAGTALGRAPAAPALPGNSKTTALQAPAFLQAAHAAGTADVLMRIDEEAGISAYFKAPDAITLSQVRSVFRVIETETADYILGSVAVSNYLENYDVHVYVHKNGWILAYYLRSDPIAKIIDALAQTLNTTKLKTVVATVAGAAGASFGDVTYYDFRYPSATHMLLVAEDSVAGNDFTIKLPSSYGYFERGWATLASCCDGSFNINGVPMAYTGADGSYRMHYGPIAASQMLPDVTHKITIPVWGVLVIIYRVPVP